MISDLNIRVNRDLCYACGICTERCIMDNLRLSVAPCRQNCPLLMNCQGYIRLMAQGREEDAVREMRDASPFGAILGRVCHHPCESVCERDRVDGAVHIRALKRYLADAYPDMALEPPEMEKETGLRAAVVGSGPAGLTAAYELRRKGHQVTVFEATAEPGGMLRYGIPGFRLPLTQIRRATGMLAEMGIVFKTGLAVGRDINIDRLEADFGAIVLALGAGEPRELSLPGQEMEGVIQGLDLLRRFNEGAAPSIGRSVIVIGGGNAAVDSALVCRLLGAEEVRLVCLEERSQMPAFETELREAVEEGIILENGWGPTGFAPGTEQRIGIEFSRCLALFDDQGRFRPELEPTCGLRLEADTVVVAIGQILRIQGLPDRLADPATGLLVADPLTRQCPSQAKTFVCGDCHSGPSSVVEAMASGREAAISVDRFLKGDGMRWGRGFWNGPNIQDYEADLNRAQGGPRGRLEKRKISECGRDEEIEKTMTAEQAGREAERCISCGRAAEINHTCWYCLPCEIDCPVQALEVRMPYQVR